ncbi:MAG: FHA domain-containing protein [Chloroflexales bacterium]
MRVELAITSGARAGQKELLEMPLIRIGRHPANDVRFHPELDTDVSGMRCEIKVIGARLMIHDSNSTNGTFVNGERVREDRPIYDGDVIGLGAHGPQLTLGAAAARPPEATRVASSRDAAVAANASARASVAAPASAGRLDTQARVAIAVKEQTNSLRTMVIGLAVVVVLVVIGVVAYGKRSGDKAEQDLKAALARNDSLSALVTKTVGAMKGKVGGLDSALALSKAEGDKLRSELANGSKSGDLTQRLLAAESRQRQIVSAAQLDYEAIAAKSSPAVVFIAVQLPSGKKVSGSGFNVLPSGLIVTNKHVVQDENGGAAVRIAVEFDKTKAALKEGMQEELQGIASVTQSQPHTPASTPSSSDSGTLISVASSPSSRLFRRRTQRNVATGARRASDVPKSPRSTPLVQAANRTTAGRSRPRRSRSCAVRAGVAVRPR